jgi:predicted nuclease with RNAse H fold
MTSPRAVAEAPASTVFVGIDLAADPRRTGLAVLHEDDRCVVQQVCVGAEDDALVQAVRSAGKAGVDVPFGWPEPFVELLAAHAAGVLPAPGSTGPDWRRDLAMRTTDRAVHRRTGLTPLSVSTDRIAYPALRWAGLEARLRELGIDVSRDGSGTVCEVYPATPCSPP